MDHQQTSQRAQNSRQSDVAVPTPAPRPAARRSRGLRRVQRTAGNQAVQPVIQAKLKIGAPDDKYEREADRVADLVMRMPESRVRRTPT